MVFVPVIWKEKYVGEESLLVGLCLGILQPGARLYLFIFSAPPTPFFFFATAITF